MENGTLDLGNGVQATINEQGQLTLTQATLSAEQVYDLMEWLSNKHFPLLNTLVRAQKDRATCEACSISYKISEGYHSAGEYSYCSNCCTW